MNILLVSGFHAREFFPVESLMHLVFNINEKKAASMFMLDDIVVYAIPMINPDGRETIERDGDHCWRGNSERVDIERNFGWGFHKNNETEERSGDSPFSTAEARILRELLNSISFDAYISLHSGIRQIYVPFADNLSKEKNMLHSNTKQMLDIAATVSKVMFQSVKLVYKYGIAYQLAEYTADGTSMDYAAGHIGVPFSFTLELWGEGDIGGEGCFRIFNPPDHELARDIDKVSRIYDVILQELLKYHRFNHQRRTVFNLVLFVIAFLLILIFIRILRQYFLLIIKYICRKIF